MNLIDISIIKTLLKTNNAKPQKFLGQHFILSKKILTAMIAAAEIKSSDTIVEIGPGLGTLTQELANVGAKVIAIEKDQLMIKILKETLAGFKNIKIIQADAKNISLPISDFRYRKSDIGNRIKREETAGKYKIVANLPYNAAVFLIRRWLESKNPPELMVLMIQKEVAQRIAAKPPHLNLLAASVQFYADAKIVGYARKGLFWPRPKVDTAIIKIIPKRMTVLKRSHEYEQFFKVIKAGFSQPRKQLIGNLSKKLNIQKQKIILLFKYLNIPEQSRAENLSIEQWQNIAFQLIHNLTH